MRIWASAPVFEPLSGLFGAEADGEIDAGPGGGTGGGVEDEDFDSAAAEEADGLVAGGVGGVADDDAGNAEVSDGAGTHEAGLERGVEGGVVAVGHPAGGAEGGHFAVKDGVVFLDEAVVARAEDLAGGVVDQDGADGTAGLCRIGGRGRARGRGSARGSGGACLTVAERRGPAAGRATHWTER